MSQYEKHISTVYRTLRCQDYYDSIQQLFDYDVWQGLPPAGHPFRGNTAKFLVKQAKGELLSSDVQAAVEYFHGMTQDQFQEIRHWGAARRLARLYTKASRVPDELEGELAACSLNNQIIWREARRASDFDLYRPHMKRLFELKREAAQAADPELPPFQVMVDQFDHGLLIEDVTCLFDALKQAIPHMLSRIGTCGGNSNPALLSFKADRSRVEPFMTSLMEQTGLDPVRVSFGASLHPISYCVGPRDVRVTINYDKNIWQLLCSFLHECGHARYQYGTDSELADFGLWGGIQGAMHEGIARFYENFIGRSREFIEFAYPHVVKAFPEIAGYSPEEVYNVLNAVSPNATRIRADEVTYSLHPIIRFEMEKDYFEGKISIDDFREIWNEKYRSYLGIVPVSDAEGVLQDISWSSGYLGYFQSYALGNLYAAQIRSVLLRQIPHVYQEIAGGNFAPLNSWMQEKIFRYGSLYTASEMIEQVSGKPLETGDFLGYLEEKYGGIR